MTCQKSTELILDWIEGELSPEEAAAVEAHVAECPDCAREVEQLRTVLGAIGQPAVDPGEQYFDSFYARLRERIDHEATYVPWTVKLWRALWTPGQWLRPVAATLTLLLVAAGAYTGISLIDFGQPQEQTMVAGVAKSKPLPSDYFVSSLDPRIAEEMAALNEEEMDQLQTQIAEVLLPSDTELTVVDPDPFVASPTYASLDENEIAELADTLAESQIEFAI